MNLTAASASGCASAVDATDSNSATTTSSKAFPRSASRLRFDDRLLFAFLFFSSILAAARGVHEGYEKVFCHPDYNNSTTIFDYEYKVNKIFITRDLIPR